MYIVKFIKDGKEYRVAGFFTAKKASEKVNELFAKGAERAWRKYVGK